LRTALAADGTETMRRDTWVNLGNALLRQGRLDDAESAYGSANAIAGHAIAFNGLAQIGRMRARDRLAQGDEQGALGELGRAKQNASAALAINPRNAQAQYVLAGILYQLGDVPGAIAGYRRVVELAPDSKTGADAAEALRQLGQR
jgi:tetratricopeptide (TPR) repeat protein